jgi:hypothetical protein
MTTEEEQGQPLKRAGKRNPAFESQVLKDMFSWMEPNMRIKVANAYRNDETHNAKLYDFLEDLAKVVYGDEAINKITKEADAEAEAKVAAIKAEVEAKVTKEKPKADYIT